MAENRLIGGYPVIGIRPTIDGRVAEAYRACATYGPFYK